MKLKELLDEFEKIVSENKSVLDMEIVIYDSHFDEEIEINDLIVTEDKVTIDCWRM